MIYCDDPSACGVLLSIFPKAALKMDGMHALDRLWRAGSIGDGRRNSLLGKTIVVFASVRGC